MSPSRAPPGDAIMRCRDTIDVVSAAPGHKYNREKCELLQLLSLPHLQVCNQKVYFVISATDGMAHYAIGTKQK